jgi:hypothetical protein
MLAGANNKFNARNTLLHGGNAWKTVCTWARVPNSSISSFEKKIAGYRKAYREAKSRAGQNALVVLFNKDFMDWYAPHRAHCEKVRKELNNLMTARRAARSTGRPSAGRPPRAPRASPRNSARNVLEAKKAHAIQIRNQYAKMVNHYNSEIKKLSQRN